MLVGGAEKADLERAARWTADLSLHPSPHNHLKLTDNYISQQLLHVCVLEQHIQKETKHLTQKESWLDKRLKHLNGVCVRARSVFLPLGSVSESLNRYGRNTHPVPQSTTHAGNRAAISSGLMRRWAPGSEWSDQTVRMCASRGGTRKREGKRVSTSAFMHRLEKSSLHTLSDCMAQTSLDLSFTSFFLPYLLYIRYCVHTHAHRDEKIYETVMLSMMINVLYTIKLLTRLSYIHTFTNS